jgi:hypothetical protein
VSRGMRESGGGDDTVRRLRSALAGTRWTNPAERSQNFTRAGKGKCKQIKIKIRSSASSVKRPTKHGPVSFILRILAPAPEPS